MSIPFANTVPLINPVYVGNSVPNIRKLYHLVGTQNGCPMKVNLGTRIASPCGTPVNGLSPTNIIHRTQVIPARASRELVVSPTSSVGFPFPMAQAPVFGTTQVPVQVNASRTFEVLPTSPLPPSYNPLLSPQFTSPIIKVSQLQNQGIPATIQIISANNIFTINVPFDKLRDVVNYIYLNINNNVPTNINPNQPQVSFRIITPTLDTTIHTTMDKMLEIVRTINMQYPSVTYQNQQGVSSSMAELINILNALPNSISQRYRPL